MLRSSKAHCYAWLHELLEVGVLTGKGSAFHSHLLPETMPGLRVLQNKSIWPSLLGGWKEGPAMEIKVQPTDTPPPNNDVRPTAIKFLHQRNGSSHRTISRQS